MATRNGSAEWRGDLQSGSGNLTVGDGVFEGDVFVRLALRGGGGDQPRGVDRGRSRRLLRDGVLECPDLSGHGHIPDSVRGHAPSVHLRNVDGAPTIAQIDLDATGVVPGIDEDHFQHHAEAAKKRRARCRARSRVCRRSPSRPDSPTAERVVAEARSGGSACASQAFGSAADRRGSSVRQHRHRQALVAAEQHGAGDRGRPNRSRTSVERGVERRGRGGRTAAPAGPRSSSSRFASATPTSVSPRRSIIGIAAAQQRRARRRGSCAVCAVALRQRVRAGRAREVVEAQPQHDGAADPLGGRAAGG